jgi:trk system potassium uptake protein TrkA
MNIILAADGELGLHLTKILTGENHNITVINPEISVLKEFDNLYDVLCIQGESTDIEILKSAHIHKADLLVSVLHEEQPNILTCIMGKKLGAKKTVARVSNPKNLIKEKREFFKEIGVDHIVSPEYYAANEIIKTLKHTTAEELFDFSDGKLSLFIQRLDKKALVLNKSLKEINSTHKNLHFRAVAIKRGDKTIIPSGEQTLQLNDVAYIITKPEGVNQIVELGGKTPNPINDVIIVGGGRIGRITALHLEKTANVKLIEKDPVRCQELSDILSNTLIIKGDSRNIDLLEDEKIAQTDAFISLTEDSETNVMTCLIAKKMGVYRTVALVENIDYIDVAKRIGIDIVINKKIIAASYIDNFTIGFDVNAIKILHGVDVDVIEIVAKEGSKITKAPLKKIIFPEDAIIGGVVRGKDAFIADGNTQIQANDKVVVFTSPQVVHPLSKFFA